MDIRRFGIIGCGYIATIHMDAIRQIEQAALVGVASRSEERAKAAGESNGCAWYTDYRELLARPELEFVCVTTGSGSHYAIGMDALHAGKHVIVEKPLAMTSRQADDMIVLAAKKGLTLTVVSQNRFIPLHRIVYDALKRGKLGKLLLAEVSRPFFRTQEYYDSADWRGTIAEDGGAMMNQGIHSIDLLLWLAGKPKAVIGRTSTMTHRMEAEDMALALLTMESGAFATILCSTSTIPGFIPAINLYGELGAIKIEGPTITHWSVPGTEKPQIAEDRMIGGGASDPRNVASEYHRQQLLDTIRAVDEKRRPLVTGEDGKNAVKLIETIVASSAQNGLSLAF